jgi:cytoskeletal protein CcmA (bactofilin family)
MEISDQITAAISSLLPGLLLASKRREIQEKSRFMWKPDQVDAPEALPTYVSPSQSSFAPAPEGETATIGKGLVIRGEISGTDSLVIDGRVEGSIHLEGNRVTVGREGQAAANIIAREVVVQGKVRGSIIATDRLDIRSEGGVVGDLTAPHLCIEDGAFFKGGIDIRKIDSKAAPQSALSKLGFKAVKSSVS